MPLLILIYNDFVKPILGIGLFASISGLLWKYFTDRKILHVQGGLQKEIASLGSRLDKQKESFIHVFKGKFDLEIKIYQEIWLSMFELRDAMLQMELRVSDKPHPPDEEKERTELIKKHMAFNDAYNTALTTKVKYEPFYPEEISQRIDAFMKACQKEGVRIKLTLQSRTRALPERKDEYIDEMERAYAITSNLIRTRLDQISSVDEDEIPDAMRIR
jgi:hypothetical protein